MKEIVLTQDLGLHMDQIERLKKLGKLKIYEDRASSAEEWLGRCKGKDIVCTGKFGLKEKIYNLKNVFVSLPFVGVGWIDKERIKQNKITVAYSPGCNKDAVSEWIIAMILNLGRKFPSYINTLKSPMSPEKAMGLSNRKVTILGEGNIGSRVGRMCSVFDMEITYFKRGDNLIKTVKNADFIVDCLGHNETTKGILNRKFFQSLKKGSYFITVTSSKIYDAKAMIEALDKGILAGVANDAGSIQVGDVNNPFYQKLLNHPKILVTPHISYRTDVSSRKCNDMMVDNIEAWLRGKPINLIN